MPRCVEYNMFNCDLLIGCSSSLLYRLNLESGRFNSSYKLMSESSNSIVVHESLNCLFSGGDEGVISLIDLRTEKSQGCFRANRGQNVTKLAKFDHEFEFYVGSDEGMVSLYDVRHDRPVLTKQNPYFLPIVSICKHEEAQKLIVVDKKCIRVTELGKDELFFMYEPKHEISQLTSKYVNSQWYSYVWGNAKIILNI